MKNVIVWCCIIICAFLFFKNNFNFQKCIVNANGTCITKIEKITNVNGDYLKGAIKQCGGKKNLPTKQDLLNLKSFLYLSEPGESSGIVISPGESLSEADAMKLLQEDKKASINKEHFKYFEKYAYQGEFRVLSSETRGDSVYFRDFGSSSSKYALINPTNQKLFSLYISPFVTVCVKH